MARVHRRGSRKRHRGGPRLDRRKGIAAVRSVKPRKTTVRRPGTLKLVSPISISGHRMVMNRLTTESGGTLQVDGVTVRVKKGALDCDGDAYPKDPSQEYKPLACAVIQRRVWKQGGGLVPNIKPDFYAQVVPTCYDPDQVIGFSYSPYHHILPLNGAGAIGNVKSPFGKDTQLAMLPGGGQFGSRQINFTDVDYGPTTGVRTTRHRYVYKPFDDEFARFTVHHAKIHAMMRNMFTTCRLSGQLEMKLRAKANPLFFDMLSDMLDPGRICETYWWDAEYAPGDAPAGVPTAAGSQYLWQRSAPAGGSPVRVNPEDVLGADFKKNLYANINKLKAFLLWSPHEAEDDRDHEWDDATWTPLKTRGSSTVNLNPYTYEEKIRMRPSASIAAGTDALDPSLAFQADKYYVHRKPKTLQLAPRKERVLGEESVDKYDEDTPYHTGHMAFAVKTHRETGFLSLPEWFWIYWFRAHPYSLWKKTRSGTTVKNIKVWSNTDYSGGLVRKVMEVSPTTPHEFTQADRRRLRALAAEHVPIIDFEITGEVGLTYSGLVTDDVDWGMDTSVGKQEIVPHTDESGLPIPVEDTLPMVGTTSEIDRV